MLRTAVLTLSAGFALRSDPDGAAVERAVYDYADALYYADATRVERSVHPDLAKRGFVRAPDGTYRELRMSYGELVALATRWNADGRVDPAPAPREVAVLDQTATPKLTAAWGVDSLHLAEYGGQWQIVHAL